MTVPSPPPLEQLARFERGDPRRDHARRPPESAASQEIRRRRLEDQKSGESERIRAKPGKLAEGRGAKEGDPNLAARRNLLIRGKAKRPKVAPAVKAAPPEHLLP